LLVWISIDEGRVNCTTNWEIRQARCPWNAFEAASSFRFHSPKYQQQQQQQQQRQQQQQQQQQQQVINLSELVYK